MSDSNSFVMSVDDDVDIVTFMQRVLENYNHMRGVNKVKNGNMFWDAVAISASDEMQKTAFEIQLQKKKERLELPLGTPYHVFADPPDYKIGCGGSTMFVLEQLYEMYGLRLQKMRLLCIPAGGMSQRLPNLSTLGKLFSPLPFAAQNYQMLDLILAVYLPFLAKMPGGVFLASSDAIITYNLEDNDNWTFMNEGFTALAHPSLVEIGTQHGVYVLPPEHHSLAKSHFMSKCIKILQKPTKQVMYQNGAVITKELSGGQERIKEQVFSDSAFFFSSSIAMRIISLFKQLKPLHCEVSSYGDFLQPLGMTVSKEYIFDSLPASISSDELISVRTKLYSLLHGTPLHILVLNHSKFHHLGTMKEYIENLCMNSKLRDHLQMPRFCHSSISGKYSSVENIKGTIINSIISPLCHIPESVLIEYCDIDAILECGEQCILSNCQLDTFCIPFLRLPQNVLIHTVALTCGFVTVAFNIYDNIKKLYTAEEIMNITFLSLPLRICLLQYSSDHEVFDSKETEFSLWNAKLFPLASTRQESFMMTIFLISAIHEIPLGKNCYTMPLQKFLSMQDILKFKDINKMLEYQNKFLEKGA